MRAITIRQPHAWAVIHADKVENRTRNIAGEYRGWVAIHAGLAKYEQDNASSRAHRAAQGTEVDTRIVYGAVIGVARLIDVHLSEDQGGIGCGGLDDDCASHLCSPFALPDNFHFVWADRRPLATPIPWRGSLPLWTVPDDLEAAIREQVDLS